MRKTQPSMANKQGKMQNLVNYRMRVTLNDGRQMTGQMLAFDKVRSSSSWTHLQYQPHH